MPSSVAYERVGDESIGEAEYSFVPSPPELAWDVHSSNHRGASSEQDPLAASILARSGLEGEEPRTGPELTAIRALSIDSLQLTFSDAPRSVSPTHCNDRAGEADQPTIARYSNEATLVSDAQKSTKSYGARLPSRTTIQRDVFWCLAWVFDVLLTLIPFIFLAIAALALHLDHQPRSDLGERALAASRLGPTIFPIAFAAITSRFFENLSRWRLERPKGIKLGELEQIAGSQSFPGAVQRAFTVRSGHWIPTMIIMIWALSPIGGQSSLRLFIHGHQTLEKELDVFVANPEYQESTFTSLSGISDDSNTMSTIYSGLLLSAAPQRAAPADLWSRPKIPQLSHVMANNQDTEWQEVSETGVPHAEDYASLLGLDVRGITQDIPGRQLRFNVNTSYVDMNCERVTDYAYKNITLDSSFEASIQIYTDRGWYFNTEPAGHRLLYDTRGSRNLETLRPTRFECVLRRVPVEIEFHCGPFPTTGCGARRLRPREARFDTAPSAWGQTEPMDGLFQILPWSMTPNVVPNMLDFWPIAAGKPDYAYGASATDNFLAGDEALFVSQKTRDWDHDASNITMVSRRMTTMFNTIFHVSLHPRNVTTADPLFTGNSSDYLDPDYDVIQATAWDTHEIYIADRRWCACLLIIGSILQVVAIAGLWLRAWIAGPNILGYASSLMRDNPYFPESASSCGSALGGADRSRMCRDMRVQITDVRPFEERGYIVFKPVPFQGDGDLARGKQRLDGKRLFE